PPDPGYNPKYPGSVSFSLAPRPGDAMIDQVRAESGPSPQPATGAVPPAAPDRRGSWPARVFRGVIRVPLGVGRAARRHPRLVALLALLLVAGAGVGVWRYAVFPWK